MTRLRADRPRNHGSIPGTRNIYFYSPIVSTCPGVHPPTYLMCTGGADGQTAEAWSWLFTFNQCRGYRMSGVVPHYPHLISLRAKGQFYIFILSLYLQGICVNLAPPSHGLFIYSLCRNLFICSPNLYVPTFRKNLMSSRPGLNSLLVLDCLALKMKTVCSLKCRLAFTNDHASCPWKS